MSGTFTQKRNKRLGFMPGVHVNRYGNVTNTASYMPQPAQTTTSFRSSASEGVITPATAEDSFKEFKNAAARPLDYGHPFSTQRTFVLPSHTDWELPRNSTYPMAYYRGPLGVTSNALAFGGLPAIDVNDAYYGTLAIKNTRPLSPKFQSANLVGELLREGIPLLAGVATANSVGRLKPVKNAGSEWLNVTFGWLPIAAAIHDLAEAVVNLQSNLEQYIRDSERLVRRRMDFDPIVGTMNLTPLSAAERLFVTSDGGAPTEFRNQGATVSRIANTNQRYWFSGAYTYYIGKVGSDPFSDLAYYSKLANQLLGTEITPEVIYNLTPWSWLLDWFANFGDIISNAVYLNPDNQVLAYGYLMCQTVQDDILTVSGGTCNGVPLPTYSVISRRVDKRRVRANPYGFTTNPNLFTSYQWSILAALGMTLGSNKLR